MAWAYSLHASGLSLFSASMSFHSGVRLRAGAAFLSGAGATPAQTDSDGGRKARSA
jgi:hypothetical protein